jgi:hypothetical protein
MSVAVPSASVATYINESGLAVPATYQIVFNGVAVDPGLVNAKDAIAALSKLPGVATVYQDYAHDPEMYASLPLIDAAAAWNNTAIGGQANAGKGIKFASMDGGIHHSAPMFSGAGFSYPPGWPANGKGLTANNNGKIILSRAYFRPWDPPSLGDENPWPGTQGTPHGTHTASTAAGDKVVADYRGITVTLSGVAPAAWVMSYRVFYNSITNNGSFYNVEGIAALEDIARDGADVLNNSWGSGSSSIGGIFDPLDEALINVSHAGTFVSMSNGNSGPNPGTGDHSSSEYINVAASSTTGTYLSGRASVSAPIPVSPTLQNMPFTTSSFGAVLPPGNVFTYTLQPGETISPSNITGCTPWGPGTFTGKAALIRRGTCEFGVKVLNAERGGAAFVIVYNNSGDSLINMGPGAVGNLVTIPSIFVGNSKGVGMVQWFATYGSASVVTFDTTAYQGGNTPDVIADFSSRGPGVGNVLKPDIAAPGVNILAQGFADGTGEARHLGFGQVSGTSMASPHVAGAAILLRQIHPEWSNADIKSALMSTSKYIGIYNNSAQTIPAQPLDMGAGRLDLSHAADPGVILDPPGLSFGLVPTGTQKSVTFSVRNITTATEVYTLTTLYTGAGFSNTTALAGFSLNEQVITLTAGSSSAVTAWFSSTLGSGLGDNQGYVVLKGDRHNAHLPAWARVTHATSTADILIIRNDAFNSLGLNGYLGYYTSTLTSLGYTYDVLDADNQVAPLVREFLNTIGLLNYKAVIYYTGDNFYPYNFFTVVTPLPPADMDKLVEYANNGGTIIAMGQDMASVLASTDSANAHLFYNGVLGGLWWRDSVTNNALPDLPIGPTSGSPLAFQGIHLDLKAPATYTASVALTPDAEVTSTLTGLFTASYDVATRLLNWSVTLSGTAPYTITAITVHSGTLPATGALMYTLNNTITPVTITNSAFSGYVIIASADIARILGGGAYVNIDTEAIPGGEVNGQLLFNPNTDGAGNQAYIDEIGIDPSTPAQRDPTDPLNPLGLRYRPVLKYPGSGAVEDNVVTMAHRDQPTLEVPGISYLGRSVYASFGLEGVNNTPGNTSREALMQTFLNYAWDKPTASISRTTVLTNSSKIEQFTANFSSNIISNTAVSYRWDYGDGKPYMTSGSSPVTVHPYQVCGRYTVRVEITDAYGNHTIGTQEVNVTRCVLYRLQFPVVMKTYGN